MSPLQVAKNIVLQYFYLILLLFFVENLELESVLDGTLVLWNIAIESFTKHFQLIKFKYFINLFLWLFYFNSKYFINIENENVFMFVNQYNEYC